LGAKAATLSRVSAAAAAAPGSVVPPRNARGTQIDLRPVQPLIDRIVASWHPREIWLFGSRARGTADGDSDWDLLVVIPDALAAVGFDDPLVVWSVKQGTGVRADVLVCRASEFDEDRGTHNTIAYDAAVEGIRIS
jgi:predicted nucleotidyltransferase